MEDLNTNIPGATPGTQKTFCFLLLTAFCTSLWLAWKLGKLTVARMVGGNHCFLFGPRNTATVGQITPETTREHWSVETPGQKWMVGQMAAVKEKQSP